MPATSNPAHAAVSMLDKLRRFLADLSDDERAAFAALVGPGVALAYDEGADDVTGYQVGWSRSSLPDHLADVIRQRDVRVVGL
jgi:hypothetical protein